MKKMIVYECLREYLKNVRVRSNLTQAQLAKMLHVCPQTISAYERGVNVPSYETIIHYMNLFETIECNNFIAMMGAWRSYHVHAISKLVENLKAELSIETKQLLLKMIEITLDINQE